MLPEITFINSKKGYQLLVYEHYTYAKNSRSKSRISWACSSRCSRKCDAQLAITTSGELLVINNEHSHPPPVFYINDKGKYVRISDKYINKLNHLTKEEIENYNEHELQTECSDEGDIEQLSS